jgi:hypothetical protein
MIGILLVGARSATTGAQLDQRVQPGVRVRAWLPEPRQQDSGPWRRQLLRATVSEVSTDTIRLVVPGTSGSVAVARTTLRRLDVSRGTSRPASAFERAFAFAVTAAISTALENDPGSNEWPHYSSNWRAAGEGAKWGAALGAVIGFVLPTERWRKVRLR